MSYTSGPWITKREGYSTVYVEARIGGGLLQEVAACGPTANGKEEQEANARLIAAAPELLAALQEITEDYADRFDLESPSTNPGIKYVIKQARSAIAKATGG